MSSLFRDAPVGQIIRLLTKNKVLLYPEEKPDFTCPHGYNDEAVEHAVTTDPTDEKGEEVRRISTSSSSTRSVTTPATLKDEENPMDGASTPASQTLSKVVTRPEMDKVTTRRELEQAYTNATQLEAIKQQPTVPIVPTKTAEGVILVDWYTTDDPENPQNWSSKKKGATILQIYLYTLAVYMSSAIYTPSAPDIERIFGVSTTASSLGLALYVLGYGIGPLLFSPISEIPAIGRNPPYMATFGIFVILAVPTALVDNFAGLLVLRFLQGFFGSPCLATGGASIGDLFSLLKLPYFITGWAGFATMGPALGPVISGFSVPAENWRWSLWEILWMSGPVFLVMMFFLPETSSSNILLRRAARLRKITGNPNLKSQSEIDQAKMTVRDIAYENLVRPWLIHALDPALLFTAIYTSLVYAIYYSFFEVFPIVYIGIYGFNIGQMGLVFLVILVALFIAIPTYFYYLKKVFEPEIMTKGLLEPERRLIPALFTSFFPPIGLFIYGWTSRESVHWIVSVIGIGIYTIGIFLLIQCIFIYIPLTYPQYAASLFAGNDFARSALAAGAILFARPLFLNLGVGPGISLLAGLTVGCIGGIYALYFFGAKLRARSKFAAK